MVLLTIGALFVGLVGVGVIQMLPSGGTETAAAGDVMVPTELPPAELVSDRSLGRADAPVTLTVWSDFQCPACRMLAQAIEPRLIRDYVSTGKLRIDYKDLVVIGPESVDAAVGARCAAEQNRFWDYHGVLYANQAAENSGAITHDRLLAFADRLGLDRPAFESCLGSGHMPMHVQTEAASASTRFQSTPTLEFSDGSVISGVPAWEALAAKLDALIAAA
jgi:protein-disulfide isomerase